MPALAFVLASTHYASAACDRPKRAQGRSGEREMAMLRSGAKGVAVLLSLCAGSCSSGVMTLGPDTYRIDGSRGLMAGGSMLAQKEALDEANRYCAQQNKQFMAIGTYDKGNGGLIAGGGYQLDFRCLNSDDPGLARPTPTPAPNIVIQDQRRH